MSIVFNNNRGENSSRENRERNSFENNTASDRNYRSDHRQGGRSRGFSSVRSKFSKRKYVAKTPKWTQYIQKAEPIVPEVEVSTKTKFTDFKLNAFIQAKIEKKGYLKPTPIQEQTIPPILEGRDLLGLAQTGTGKTAAFLIPMLNHTLQQKEEGKTFQTLIIAPTRELAIQIEEELFELKTKQMDIFATVCVGGSSITSQIHKLSKLNHFIIGTPGRINDLIRRDYIDTSKIEAVVLDEVDCMLDMGFIDEIKTIFEGLPTNCQKLFFSATLPVSMKPLVDSYLNDPVRIEITSQSSSKNVEQTVIKVANANEKYNRLVEMLSEPGYERVLIFTQMKITAQDLSVKLKKSLVKADAIHGDKRLNERRRTLDSFKRGFIRVLVATDVAARGIDVKNVTHVINYDEPDNYQTYVHRIGRTGRAGKMGHAHTFVIMD